MLTSTTSKCSCPYADLDHIQPKGVLSVVIRQCCVCMTFWVLRSLADWWVFHCHLRVSYDAWLSRISYKIVGCVREVFGLTELVSLYPFWRNDNPEKYLKCLIGDILKMRMACMKLYTSYITNETKIFELLGRWQQENSDFARVCSHFEVRSEFSLVCSQSVVWGVCWFEFRDQGHAIVLWQNCSTGRFREWSITKNCWRVSSLIVQSQ